MQPVQTLLGKMSYGVYRDILHLKVKVGKVKVVNVMKTVKNDITMLRVVTTKINVINLNKQREEEVKIFDNFIFTNLYSYLNVNNQITKNQSGFRQVTRQQTNSYIC